MCNLILDPSCRVATKATTRAGSSIKTLTSPDLFAGKTQVHIQHAGQVYRLSITRQNKLILTK